MDKRQVKQLQITEVIVNQLSSSPDIEGEWHSYYDIDFMLSEPFSFKVFDKIHLIDRIKMQTHYDEGPQIEYANQTSVYWSLAVTKTLVHKVLDRVKVEQDEGCLKGWAFDDDLLEMLKGERNTSSFPMW
ncbi:hypothetical protein [Paenibacillus sp. Leaf72]|uniref:hypothetical protein n=1 Tax=Paenibacillus sp. Leaf72 TaxID=1736234 RepID=UPI0006F5FA4E|nr:hypothetical protein [Paenibacillus sp. Leaf72]KQN96820.1 hypothetical protein ASF12_22370 [Paenibacillus sp. Leaf72]